MSFTHEHLGTKSILKKRLPPLFIISKHVLSTQNSTTRKFSNAYFVTFVARKLCTSGGKSEGNGSERDGRGAREGKRK